MSRQDNKTIISIYADAAGCGKSTLAKAMAARLATYGHPVLYLSFAKALRQVATDILRGMGYTDVAIRRYLNEEKDDVASPLCLNVGPTGRGFLKAVGEAARNLDPDIWVNTATNRIDAMPAGSIVIMDDMRRDNERDALASRGAVFVHLKNPSFTTAKGDMEGMLTDVAPDHVLHMRHGEDIDNSARCHPSPLAHEQPMQPQTGPYRRQ